MNVRLLKMEDVEIPSVTGVDLFVLTSNGSPRSHAVGALFIEAPPTWSIHIGQWPDEPVTAPCTAVSLGSFRTALWQMFEQHGTTDPNILIDISCMSREMMAEVFSSMFYLAGIRTIQLTVAYSIAAYAPPPLDLPPNEDIRPISDEFAGWEMDPCGSTAVIVGLGYERNQAQGAVEYFDASDTWIYLPLSPITEYDESIRTNNQELIERATQFGRAIPYQMQYPSQTFGQLATVVGGLEDRPIVLLPLGPKLFFSLALLTAALYPNTGVWDVVSAARDSSSSEMKSDHTIGYSVLLGPEQQSAE